MKVVGSEFLGGWEVAFGVALDWTEGDNWQGTIELPESEIALEFKLVKVAGDDYCAWEDGANRHVNIPDGVEAVTIVAPWGDASATEVHVTSPAAQTAAKKATKSTTGTKKRKSSKKKEAAVVGAEEERQQEQDVTESVEGSPAGSATETVTPREEEQAPPTAAADAVDLVQEVSEEEDEEENTPETVEHGGVFNQTEERTREQRIHSELGNGASLPEGFAGMVDDVALGADGTLTISFGDTAAGVDAATLASKLQS
jgi:hypothetical protein